MHITMKTLYLSDLDGTLLRSNEKTSDYTNRTINELTKKGMIFSYATARSVVTAKKVTAGITAKIPIIEHNGVSVRDSVTNDIIATNCFDGAVLNVLDDLFENGIYPIVYAFFDGKDKFSFVRSKCSKEQLGFVESRRGDIRTNEVYSPDDLKNGDVFYITCIDEAGKLLPFYEKYKSLYRCLFQRNLYTGEQWLEIMPKYASKANAAVQLKNMLGCERLVVFGDGENDIDMFEAADECYATANADDKLKEIATAVIGSNDEDAVARWLADHFV